jgi:Apea-like HEPN
MSETLFRCCEGYVDALEKRFSETRRNLGERIVTIHHSAVLPNAVEAAENESEFQGLVQATQVEFQHIHRSSNRDKWATALQNLFRRAGFYQELFEKKPISVAHIHDVLSDQFQRKTVTVTYLAPLEHVWFAGSSMDFFGEFQIRRYTLDELEELIRNTANRTFYPRTETDLKVLAQNWFISVTKEVHRHEFEELTDDFLTDYDFMDHISSTGEVKLEWPRFSPVLELPLRTLILWDWKPDTLRLAECRSSLPEAWHGFSIPGVWAVSNTLLAHPASSPNFTGPELRPRFDQEGEEIGEGPWFPIHLDEQETRAFEATIRRTSQLLAEVKTKEHGWDFIDVAMNYLLKAFFAHGLDQLLWHIIVVEALVGEKREALGDRLKRRVGRCLAKTEKERKALRDTFKDLYDFRSKLVHGSPFEKEKAHEDHLTQARDIARRLLLWFLHFAHSAQQGSGPYPTRDDFLRLLDLDSDERERVVHLAQTLPSDFPSIEAWTA